jgi:hypothetical protein
MTFFTAAARTSLAARILLIVCLWITGASLSWAQQAIINLPSADVTPKGKNFLMHETQWKGWGKDGYWYGTNFYAYGLGKSTELAITNWNSGTPASPDFATGIGYKSNPQILKEKFPHSEVRLTFGQMAVISHRGLGLGHFSYSHLSFRTPVTHTRLTGGGFFGTRQLFGKNTGHFIAGLEQPLMKHERLVWVNEWFAGNHDFGYYITGVLVQPYKKNMFVVAYKIPNHVKGTPGIVLEYGLTF